MRTLRLLIYCSALLAGTASCALAQSQARSTETIIVMPFENASGAPGLQWISEAFPAFLSQRLVSDTIFPLTREDRLRAYDRAGIPAEVQPTRASIYRLVEEMDVDYVLLGRYRFDGRLFTVTAQLLDMQHRKLSAEASESGALVNLIDVQTALAWDVLHSLEPGTTVDRQTFTSITPAI